MKTFKILLSFIAFLCAFNLNAQSWLWGKQGVCRSNRDYAEGIQAAIDKYDNAYLMGTFGDSLILGSFTLNATMWAPFIVKYDSNGSLLWAKQGIVSNAGSTGSGSSIATDLDGNIYIAGHYTGQIIFGKDTSINTNYTAIFQVKYDNNGNVVWLRTWGSASYDYGYGVTTDRTGNVYLTGAYGGTLIFGADTIKSPQPTIFLTKLNSSGTVIWARQGMLDKTSNGAQGAAIASDKDNNTYVVGDFVDTLRFDTVTLKNYYYRANEVFVVKYDSNGSLIWAKQGVGSKVHGQDFGYSVCTDNNDDAYITGCYSDTISFGSHTLMTLRNKNNFFIVKYNTKGNVVWAKAANPDTVAANQWVGYSLATDNNGHLYFLAGNSLQNKPPYIVYGKDSLSVRNPDDAWAFLVLDTAANFIQGTILPSGGDDQSSVVSDGTGRYVYLGGDFEPPQSYVFAEDTLRGFGSSEYSFVLRWGKESGATGINTLSVNYGVKVYPNPSNGQFNLLLSHPELVSGSQTIEIYNVLGEQVLNETLKQVQGDNTINISNQPNGVYLYRVISETGNLLGEGKIIIEK